MTTIAIIYQKGSVYLRVTKNRKHKYRSLFRLDASYWDAKNNKVKYTHENSVNYNSLISSKLSEVQRKILDYESDNTYYDMDDLFAEKSRSDKFLSEVILDFADRKYNEGGTNDLRRKYINVADKVKKFGDIKANNINPMYVRGWVKFLENQNTINSKTTVHRYLKFFKTVLRQTGYMNHEIIPIKVAPGKTTKIKLTPDQFAAIENYTNPTTDLYKDLFCALVYSGGLRVGDMLQMQYKHYQAGRLIFTEQKTGKEKSVLVIKKLADIFDKYNGQSNFYLFPLLTNRPPKKVNDSYQEHIKSKTAIINRMLKVVAAGCEIDKPLSTHVARHTFATWASHRGVDISLISKILNHSDISTTKNYINELNMQSEIDEAIQKTINY